MGAHWVPSQLRGELTLPEADIASRCRQTNEEDEEAEFNEDLQYGIRTSRDRTTYEYRESSSLNPGQILEQETYYFAAESWLGLSMNLAEIAAGLSAVLAHHLNLSRYQPAVTWITTKILALKVLLEGISFWIMWVMSHVELCLLRAEDLTVFSRRRHQFQPHRWRRIAEIERDNGYRWVLVYRHDLVKLHTAWRIPNMMRAARSAHVYDGEECFIIYLFPLMQGAPFTTMARHYFGGDPRRMSEMFEIMVNHIYFTFYNKISGTSLDQWVPAHLNTCRELIHGALMDTAIHETTTVDGEVVDSRWIIHHFDLASFRIFGFIDDFALRTSRPGNSATRNFGFRQDIQRAF